MRLFEKALIDTLRLQPSLISATVYSNQRLSITMAVPSQSVLKPSLLVEVDVDPLNGADSSALKESNVSLYAIGGDRGSCLTIRDAIIQLFNDPVTKLERKLDISNDAVYCIGSRLGPSKNPVRNNELDCFESVTVVTFKWSLK